MKLNKFLSEYKQYNNRIVPDIKNELFKNNSSKKNKFKLNKHLRTASLVSCSVIILVMAIFYQSYFYNDNTGMGGYDSVNSSQNGSSNQISESDTLSKDNEQSNSTSQSDTSNNIDDPIGGGGSSYNKEKISYDTSFEIPMNIRKYIDPNNDLNWLADILKDQNETNINLPIIYKIIKHYNLPKEKFLELMKDEPGGMNINCLIFNPDILYSEDEKLIEYYYADLSSVICYHNILYHTIGYIADYYFTNRTSDDYTDDPEFYKYTRTLSSTEDLNIVNLINYFKVPKDKFIDLAKKSNINIDADVVYSNDKKRIYNYFKDQTMNCADYSFEYYVIPCDLLKYAGFGYLPYKATIEENMAKVNWMLKYRDDPNGINIVNFVRDNNIPKDIFIKYYQIDADHETKDVNYIADIIYSNDQQKIDDYYKLK